MRCVQMPTNARFIEKWAYPLCSQCYYDEIHEDPVIIDFDEPIVAEKSEDSECEMIEESELLQSAEIVSELGQSLYEPVFERKLYKYKKLDDNNNNNNGKKNENEESDDDKEVVAEDSFELFVKCEEEQKKKKVVLNI